MNSTFSSFFMAKWSELGRKMNDLCFQDLLMTSLTICTKPCLDTMRVCIRLTRCVHFGATEWVAFFMGLFSNI